MRTKLRKSLSKCNECSNNSCHKYFLGECDNYKPLQPFKVKLLEIALYRNIQTVAEVLLRANLVFKETKKHPGWTLVVAK